MDIHRINVKAICIFSSIYFTFVYTATFQSFTYRNEGYTVNDSSTNMQTIAKTKIECAEHCSKATFCEAFAHNSQLFLCMLLDDAPSLVSQNSDGNGFRVYRKIDHNNNVYLSNATLTTTTIHTTSGSTRRTADTTNSALTETETSHIQTPETSVNTELTVETMTTSANDLETTTMLQQGHQNMRTNPHSTTTDTSLNDDDVYNRRNEVTSSGTFSEQRLNNAINSETTTTHDLERNSNDVDTFVTERYSRDDQTANLDSDVTPSVRYQSDADSHFSESEDTDNIDVSNNDVTSNTIYNSDADNPYSQRSDSNVLIDDGRSTSRFTTVVSDANGDTIDGDSFDLSNQEEAGIDSMIEGGMFENTDDSSNI